MDPPKWGTECIEVDTLGVGWSVILRGLLVRERQLSPGLGESLEGSARPQMSEHQNADMVPKRCG